MQKRLFEFTQLTSQNVSRGQPTIIHYCVNCVLDLNDSDANRFEARMFRKKVRVVLKPVAGACNMLTCPRCHAIHFTPDFYRGRSKHHKHL